MKVTGIEQLTDGKYLNSYKLKVVNKNGNLKDYYIASRRKKDKLVCVTKDMNVCDGVMILPITENDEIVVLKQYRPAIDDYLYELPAGMVDSGESFEETAVRELYEETGLKMKELEVIVGPRFTSVGMTDETTAVVKMIVEGDITNEHIEENEDIEIMKIHKSKIKEFVKTHNFSLKGSLILLGINEF